MLSTLIGLYERDLNKVITEINLFRNEADLWKVKEGITNSAGNLAMHINGSLEHFIGAVLGKTGYVRNRDLEFSAKDIPRDQIVEGTKKAIDTIKHTLSTLPEVEVQQEFPVAFGGSATSTERVLILFLAHVNYHLGQINYLRRMLED